MKVRLDPRVLAAVKLTAEAMNVKPAQIIRACVEDRFAYAKEGRKK
jgi:hypothetical protein